MVMGDQLLAVVGNGGFVFVTDHLEIISRQKRISISIFKVY